MLNIIIGSYDHLIIGYKVLYNDEIRQSSFDNLEISLKSDVTFTDSSHMGMIRSLSLSQNGWLVSGSNDHTIKVFNLLKNIELGSLQDHNGAVRSVAFFKDYYLFSASDDGQCCTWDVRDGFNLLSKFRVSSEPVISLAIHPSGRLAISIARDLKMKTWNLIDGRLAHISVFKKSNDAV